MKRFYLFLLAGLCWSWDIVRAQRSRSQRMGSGRHGYYSSFGRNISGRRWNHGEINGFNLNNPPSPSYNKVFAAAHVPRSAYYGTQVQKAGGSSSSSSPHYDYTSQHNTNHFTTMNNRRFYQGSQESESDDTELTSTTEPTTEVVVETDSTATSGTAEAFMAAEGLFMRRLRFPSGPHIVRDSWCRVSESKDCVPAL